MTVLLTIAVIALIAVQVAGRDKRRAMQRRIDLLEDSVRGVLSREWERTQAEEAAPAPRAPQPHVPPAAAAVSPPEPAAAPDAVDEPEHEPQSDDVPVPQPVEQPAVAASVAAAATPPVSVRETPKLQRLLAEHALSIIGGLFVLVAIVLFLTYAINAGWINETLRTVLAALFAAALAAVGIRLAGRLPEGERDGRAIGSLHGVLAGTACGIAVLDIVVASRRYDLLDPTTAFVASIVVGAATMFLARVWKSQDLAAFGMVTALAAPVLVDAPPSAATLVLLAVSIVAALAYAVVAGWPRLAFVAAVVTLPQVSAWAYDESLGGGWVIGVVALWWAAHVASVLVHAIARSGRSGAGAVVGTIFAATIGAGTIVEVWFSATDDAGWRPVLLTVFALVHVALGGWLLARRRADLAGHAVSILCLGGALGAIAVANSFEGTAITLAWAAQAVALSAIWWTLRDVRAAIAAILLGLLALLHLLSVSAPFVDPTAPIEYSYTAVVAALGMMAVAFVARRVTYLPYATAWRPRARDFTSDDPEATVEVERPGDGGAAGVRRIADVFAFVMGWHSGALTILTVLTPGDAEPPLETLATLAGWTALAVVLVTVLAERTRRFEWSVLAGFGAVLTPLFLEGRFATGTGFLLLLVTAVAVLLAPLRLARLGATAWLGAAWFGLLALVVAFVSDAAPNQALATGLEHPLAGFGMLAALTLVLAGASRLATDTEPLPGARRWIQVGTSLLGVYIVSAAVVRLLTNPPGDPQQDAQVALSITWAVLGIGALAVGARAKLGSVHVHALRIGGYVLLAAACGKVLLNDTARLETPFRVAVFLGVGLLLLGAARLEQVLRARDDGRDGRGGAGERDD